MQLFSVIGALARQLEHMCDALQQELQQHMQRTVVAVFADLRGAPLLFGLPLVALGPVAFQDLMAHCCRFGLQLPCFAASSLAGCCLFLQHRHLQCMCRALQPPSAACCSLRGRGSLP